MKVFAFKFLILLLLCCNILFYFNCNSLTIANGRYILLNINIEKIKIKAMQLLYSIYSWYCQGNPSSIIFLNISIWFGNKNRKNCFLFFPHGLKKKTNIILISHFLISFQFTLHYFYVALFNFLDNFFISRLFLPPHVIFTFS